MKSSHERIRKMKTRASQKRTKPYIGIIFLAAALLIAFCFLLLRKPKAQRNDYKQISSMSYDTVFLSMYPLDTYCEEDFAVYRGMTVFKSSYCIPSFSVLEQYMKQVAKSGNSVSTVYLGIRPDRTTPRQLQELAQSYPSAAFEVILSHPSADYWKSLTAEEYRNVLDAYVGFLSTPPDVPNLRLYFYASQEWLVSNPDCYIDEWLVTENTAREIMLHSDYIHNYLVTDEKAAAYTLQLTELTEKIRNTTEERPDLSGCRVIFLGDSVIGNYTDCTSIPGVVSALSGADTFNCGYGGNTASLLPGSLITLPGIAEALVKGDLTPVPKDVQVYSGLVSYLAAPPSDQKTFVVIYYGLNDYFIGCPISSEDPFDISSYSGAIRSAVTTLRTHMPDVRIILCTPNRCRQFNFGTEPHGEGGHVLEDYANAVVSLSEELQTGLLDTYHDFELDENNWYDYLGDEVHPDASFRFLISEKLIRLLQ